MFHSIASEGSPLVGKVMNALDVGVGLMLKLQLRVQPLTIRLLKSTGAAASVIVYVSGAIVGHERLLQR